MDFLNTNFKVNFMNVSNGANHNTCPAIRIGVSYSKMTVRETNDAFSKAKELQGAKK